MLLLTSWTNTATRSLLCQMSVTLLLLTDALVLLCCGVGKVLSHVPMQQRLPDYPNRVCTGEFVVYMFVLLKYLHTVFFFSFGKKAESHGQQV